MKHVSIKYIHNDWFDNPDWKNRSDDNIITPDQIQPMLDIYPKIYQFGIKGRIKFFNKQVRSWKKIYKNY